MVLDEEYPLCFFSWHVSGSNFGSLMYRIFFWELLHLNFAQMPFCLFDWSTLAYLLIAVMCMCVSWPERQSSFVVESLIMAVLFYMGNIIGLRGLPGVNDFSTCKSRWKLRCVAGSLEHASYSAPPRSSQHLDPFFPQSENILLPWRIAVSYGSHERSASGFLLKCLLHLNFSSRTLVRGVL